jgi:hypothetical protein
MEGYFDGILGSDPEHQRSPTAWARLVDHGPRVITMPKKSKPDDVDFHEETDSPTYADDRNFYKVEKWTKDGTKVDRSPRRKNCSLGQSSIGRGSD